VIREERDIREKRATKKNGEMEWMDNNRNKKIIKNRPLSLWNEGKEMKFKGGGGGRTKD